MSFLQHNGGVLTDLSDGEQDRMVGETTVLSRVAGLRVGSGGPCIARAASTGELAYAAGCVVVLHDTAYDAQRFYDGHARVVECIALRLLDVRGADGDRREIGASAEAGEFGGVRVWDVRTLQTLHVIASLEHGLRALALAPSGLFLATVSEPAASPARYGYGADGDEDGEAAGALPIVALWALTPAAAASEHEAGSSGALPTGVGGEAVLLAAARHDGRLVGVEWPAAAVLGDGPSPAPPADAWAQALVSDGAGGIYVEGPRPPPAAALPAAAAAVQPAPTAAADADAPCFVTYGEGGVQTWRLPSGIAAGSALPSALVLASAQHEEAAVTALACLPLPLPLPAPPRAGAHGTAAVAIVAGEAVCRLPAGSAPPCRHAPPSAAACCAHSQRWMKPQPRREKGGGRGMQRTQRGPLANAGPTAELQFPSLPRTRRPALARAPPPAAQATRSANFAPSGCGWAAQTLATKVVAAAPRRRGASRRARTAAGRCGR